MTTICVESGELIEFPLLTEGNPVQCPRCGRATIAIARGDGYLVLDVHEDA